jgi:heterodisulfide reductase subunit C
LTQAVIKLGGKNRKKIFLEQVKQLLPEGGNLNACLTCGACASGCPATGLDNMDPRKFLRMAALGMDDEIIKSDWPWMCTMCQRCVYVCPMQIDIPQLIFNARTLRPREDRPKGILASCDMSLKTVTTSAMGTSVEDFEFVVEDVLEEYQEAQPEFAKMQAPIDKMDAEFFLNQNSREPVTEPDEMVPLWKILHLAGVDWTYGSEGWAGENYCMFLADDDSWKSITSTTVGQANKLKSKTFLNTE